MSIRDIVILMVICFVLYELWVQVVWPFIELIIAAPEAIAVIALALALGCGLFLWIP